MSYAYPSPLAENHKRYEALVAKHMDAGRQHVAECQAAGEYVAHPEKVARLWAAHLAVTDMLKTEGDAQVREAA